MRIIKPRSTADTATGDNPRIADLDTAPAAAPERKAAPKPASWPGMELLTDPITAEVLMSVWSGDCITIVPSPPGSGKTRLTTLLAAALSHRAGLRVGIAAQTRAQAIDIARRLSAVCDHTKVGLLWGRTDTAPDTGGCPIIGSGMSMWPDTGGCIRVATKSKWLFSEPDRLRADVLIVDEAYQATYGDVGALGSMATQIVCVGDPGQIDPVITGDTTRWATSPTGPHVPAPFALTAAHPGLVNTVKLQHTWRLGPDTTALVSSRFYPALPFTSRRPVEHLSKRGQVLPELTHRQVRVANGATDGALIRAAVDRVHELIDDTDLTTVAGTRHLTEDDVAVVVPHVPQAAAVRAMTGAPSGRGNSSLGR
jgi:energy-coupling factor transporter ATP-binding protein EcfA2